MRFNLATGLSVTALGLALSACGGGGPFNRDVPDEFAVSRNAPLVIPPDYNLAPPRPGAPRPLDIDSRTQALRALFPNATAAPASPAERNLIDESGATPDATIGARSTAGDPDTKIVNKGAFTKDIVEAPVTQGDVATVTTGG